MTLKRQLLPACLGLALTAPCILRAASQPESAEATPFVESALLQPTDVGFAGKPDSSIRAALEDPSAGGVLTSCQRGSARLIGPPGAEAFSARVAVDLLDENTSVEIRVLDGHGIELNSVVLVSRRPGRWSGSICEVPPSQNGQVTLSVIHGRALGTAYRIDTEHVTTIPILSRAPSARGQAGTLALARSLLPKKQRTSMSALSSGEANYTSNYQTPGTHFYFLVQGGPPNTCGDIHTFRNGSWIISDGWLCTDGDGYGAKGPWFITSTFPGQDQTDDPTYS